MTLVTCDANTLASGFLRGNINSPPTRVLNAWRDHSFVLVVSGSILEELARTLQKPYFARRLSVQQRAADLVQLRVRAVITPLAETISGVATHPEDDIVISTALSGNAQFLITGDYKLLALKQYQGVTLVTAREFLAMLPGLTDPSMA